MGNTSEHTPLFKKMKLSDPSCASTDLAYVTPSASESEHATTSAPYFSARTQSVEDEIERSKSHWSQLTHYSDSDTDEVAEESNVQVFETLRRHPTWGSFFLSFREGSGRSLVVGEKFAEGGQAELYHAHVKWRNPKMNDLDVESGVEWVLKVFKTGTFLRHLQSQWPHGMLQNHADRMNRIKSGKPQPMKSNCDVYCGTLLKDGRFGFLMVKETEDLRTHINRVMMMMTTTRDGPFSKEMAELIMYSVAEGMEWLHNLNIVHRDLKASNVLFSQSDEGWDCFVADFECSVGVVGTGFFRAPEVLQALKDEVVNKRLNIFTKAADVYSYGMTCYEILTGKFPFEGHAITDFDVVLLKGQRPQLPGYVDERTVELLNKCWQSDPEARPTFREIMNLLEVNSIEVGKMIEEIKK